MIDFPEHLKPIIDRVVESANHGETNPDGLNKICEWFELEIPDVGFTNNLRCVCFLNYIEGCYNDKELRQYEGYLESQISKITDADRVKFLREALCHVLDEGDGHDVITAQLVSSSGSKAVVGCIHHMDGYANCFDWVGVFPTEDICNINLRKKGVIFNQDDINNLKQSDLLEYWGVND